MKNTGFLLLIIGAIIVIWNGYSWLQQSQSVAQLPTEIKETYTEWNELDPKEPIESLSTIETATATHSPGDSIGTLDIPRIDSQYPVFWGSGEDTLKKGVGMYDSEWTVKPGQNGHVVLSGHRDTVFKELGALEQGDHLYVNYEGLSYEYQIRKIWITDEDDRTVIVRKQNPTLTLTTCYPFDYLGSAPQRYIIQAELVKTSSG